MRRCFSVRSPRRLTSAVVSGLLAIAPLAALAAQNPSSGSTTNAAAGGHGVLPCDANAVGPIGAPNLASNCAVAGASSQTTVGAGGVLSTYTEVKGPGASTDESWNTTAASNAFWMSAINTCYSASAGHNGCSATDTPFSGEIIFHWAIDGAIHLESPESSDPEVGQLGSSNYDWRLIAYYFRDDGVWVDDRVSFASNSSFFYADPVDLTPDFINQTERPTIFQTTGSTTQFGLGLYNSLWIGGSAVETGGVANSAVSARFASVEFRTLDGADVTDQISYSFADDAVTATPEPASMALVASGLAGLAGWQRRRRARAIAA